ncbi:MAG: ATP-binding cassette domain-containing protein [Planctomycetes bacterium]|nr:ATP-binding cassette domain-containing protein [Planctomycetota bacterium]
MSRTTHLSAREVVLERDAFHLGPLDLAVGGGECCVLRGPNGSGKSTLLAAIAGALPVARGRIELRRSEDVEVWSDFTQGVEIAPHRRAVGWLLQDLGLFPHLSIRRQCELVPGFDVKRAEHYVDRLDIADRIDRKPGTLSGGEAQRCALLRALCAPRSVLLLDEPLSAQHRSGRDRVLECVEAERERGAILLVASHIEFPGGREIEF